MLLLSLRSPLFPYTTLFRSGPVLHRDLRDLERVDEFIGGELETRRRHFAGEAAVLVLLHGGGVYLHHREESLLLHVEVDRKSTRLNSSHLGISYAVFCLKKK